MSKIDTTVGHLVDMVEKGELRLPEMQRQYVWTSTRVRDLLDSLYRGYPSGTILVWETDAHEHARDFQIDQDKNPFATFKLLLDGQQRLTSLSAVLRGESVRVRNRRRPIDIAFNLDHPEGSPLEVEEIDDDAESVTDQNNDVPDEESADLEREELSILERIDTKIFSVASKQLLRRPNWISASSVFRGEQSDWQIVKNLVESPDDPKFAIYTDRLQRLRKIKDYPYVMQVIGKDISYEEVAEIFVRVNSLGAKLRGSDLALAQVTAKWPGSLKIFEEFIEESADNTFTLDIGMLLRLMVVFATKQANFRTVSSIPLAKLKDSWEKAKEGFRFTINYLKTNAGIEDSSLLSSPFLMVPISVYGMLKDQQLSINDGKEMLRWLYIANAKGNYSASAESRLGSDLSTLFKGGSFADLLEPLGERFGRLHIEQGELRQKSVRSPLFMLAYLALKYSGAKDWRTGLGLSLNHQGNLHYIEYHHIFPKSILRKADYERAEINAISNMAFISGRANRAISNKKPEDYLPKIINERGEEALTSQCISIDPVLWKIENYRDFLDDRRVKLAERINSFIDAAYNAGKAVEIPL